MAWPFGTEDEMNGLRSQVKLASEKAAKNKSYRYGILSQTGIYILAIPQGGGGIFFVQTGKNLKDLKA